jgi:hypothetical protein
VLGGGPLYAFTNGISIVEDFLDSGKKLPVYPITVALNWQQNSKTGAMVFDSAVITNGSPGYIRNPFVRINSTEFGGQSNSVRQYGSLKVDLNGYSVPYAARKDIIVQVSGYGQTAPDYPHVRIVLPGGYSPPAGCSSPIMCTEP